MLGADITPSSSLCDIGLTYEDEENDSLEKEFQSDIVLPSNLRASTLLTEKIIQDISKSIHIFRPSKSLAELGIEEPNSPTPTAEIDVVISGGGMKCYYVAGCIAILQQQLAHNNIKIARVSGASAGAWSALFIAAGISTALIIESYHQCAESPHRYLHDVYCEDLVRVDQLFQTKAFNSSVYISGRWL